jgi:prepilin-type N-terminal cleavage/methylation domain-containing protein
MEYNTRNMHGFTLIELFIAIAIIGIIAGMTVPALRGYSIDVDLKAAVRNLKSDMELSKLRAVRANAHVVMSFDVTNNNYTVFIDDGSGGGTAADSIQNGSEATIKSVTMPAHVNIYEASFAGGAPRFNFDSRGFPNGFGGHCYMSNTNGNNMGVVLNMVGRIQVVSL